MKRAINAASVVLLFLLALGSGVGWCGTPVILSTDVGNEIDDQWAITYLLTNSDFDVQGIISAHAPSLPDPSAHRSYLLLKDIVEHRLGMSVHPPLFEGSSLPLANTSTPRTNDAAKFLIEASRTHTTSDRLTILVIGPATDVASAILLDPRIVDRIRVVAMGFVNKSGNDYWNVANDVAAWQVLFDSKVPLVIGSGDVCKADLTLDYQTAQKLLANHGTVADWLWDDYTLWYFRHVKPLRINDFSKPWMIWDIITLAYLEGLTTQETAPRPRLNADMSFTSTGNPQTVSWITHVDSKRLWLNFTTKLDAWQRTHAIP